MNAKGKPFELLASDLWHASGRLARGAFAVEADPIIRFTSKPRDCESHRAGRHTNRMDYPFEKIIVPDVSAGRIGQPEDIADAIVLLASWQARWINCATVFVDGEQGRSNLI